MCEVIEPMAVYHSHAETGSSTVCANGKQKYVMVSSIRISHLPFTINPRISASFEISAPPVLPFCGRVMRQRRCTWFSSWSIIFLHCFSL